MSSHLQIKIIIYLKLNITYDNNKNEDELMNINQSRKYTFDVNENISFIDIKEIIHIATKIDKNRMRLYCKEDLFECSYFENEILNQVIPNQSTIELIVIEDKGNLKKNLSYNQIHIGKECDKHKHKLLIYYCFLCETSICSICIFDHNNHIQSIFEKTDYLKESNLLVNDVLLNDLNSHENDVNQIKNEFISTKKELIFNVHKEFNSLVSILQQIEERFLYISKEMYDRIQVNLSRMIRNVNNIKEFSSEGLDLLKEKTHFENLLKHENIFLNFNNKLVVLSEEYIQKTNYDFCQVMSFYDKFIYLELAFNEEYKKMKSFLENMKKSMNDEFSYLSLYNKENNIERVEKNVILSRILNKNENLSLIKKSKNLSREPSFLFDNQVSESKKSISYDYSYNESDNYYSNRSFSYVNTNIKDLFFIIHPIINTSDIILLCINQEDISTIKKTISLSIPIHGIDSFLIQSSYVNTGKTMYFTGGKLENSKSSSIFLSYSPSTDVVFRHDDLPQPKSSHSTITDNYYIYSIGGESTKSCEMYNINQMKWEKMPKLNKIRMNSELFIVKNYLYAFFGIDMNNRILDTIERINIDNVKLNKKSNWEYVSFKNNSMLDLNFIYKGIVPVVINNNISSILFIGGINLNGDVSCDCVEYLINESEFIKFDSLLFEKGYFYEMNFIQINNSKLYNYNSYMNEFLIVNIEDLYLNN